MTDGPSNRPETSLDPDRFEKNAALAAAWAAEYWRTLEDRPVAPPTRPGDVLERLPRYAPESGEPFERVLGDLTDLIAPNTLHWQHPGFFGYFPCNTSEPAVLADLITSAMGNQGMLWQTAPAANELERRLLDQMAHAIGLPEGFRSDAPSGGGVIQPTASDATLAALVAARRRVFDRHPDARSDDLTLYTSDQAHSSVVKAAMIAGLARHADDRSQLRLIPARNTGGPDHGSLDADALRSAVADDVRAGKVPTFVTATLGTTATGAFDDLAGIAGVLGDGPAAPRPWLHVDAAWAGAALICPEHRAMLAGVEAADSFCFNPHKWLLTTFDCNLFWTQDRGTLVDAMSITPSYLRSEASESGEVFDYRDWGVPLGRRARALKLWFVLRFFGLGAMRRFIRGHVAMAESLQRRIEAHPRLALSCPRSLALVCLHATGPTLQDEDRLTDAVAARVNASGYAYVTPAKILTPSGPRRTIRVSIGAVATEPRHVERLVGTLSGAVNALT
ncbi:MAG: pyridoxal-dependent decarboxylase [Planctomycetota bacterium]